MSAFSLARAGRWFLQSGIQEPSGGFSRYYRSEIQKNLPVSTEISAYAAKALLFLYRTTGEREYLDAARNTISFLINQAWDRTQNLFPYEHPSPTEESRHLTYFFDSGIIIRGLVAYWHFEKDDRILDLATAAAHGMKAFWTGRDYHAILTLPDQKPLKRTAQWSTAPGCHQAKSALAWWELAEITGDETLKRQYLHMIESGMHTCRGFLAGANERLKIVDRLHAYSYFLEAMSPLLEQADVAKTYRFVLDEAAAKLRELAPEFCRSDVYAQILRARVRASHVIPVDRAAASEEAAALAAFQVESEDPRFSGGFLFGKRAGVPSPHVNPVSTTFAIQALEMWRAFQAGDAEACLQPPI
ncbi:MAG TPA: hypothetical protein VHC90_16115 [Bryobacteraceae bacterium]|nr:hypothetical protein [Bryobacteraceae bacterium]